MAAILFDMTERERKNFYSSAAWIDKRINILRRDHFECQECRKRIEKAKQEGVELPVYDRWIRPATLVHHIKHLEDFPELALDDDNLESVCMECHNRLHGRTLDDVSHKQHKKRLTKERW